MDAGTARSEFLEISLFEPYEGPKECTIMILMSFSGPFSDTPDLRTSAIKRNMGTASAVMCEEGRVKGG